ncbi:M48 family metallopeptidase [Haladaptatus sp. CMAA 1911]|uniref:M48 family metallopeptidase n=1 Tax=unclassified Haladaptatus TaxID=2622732 RepID=UPI003754DDF8
MPFLDRLILVPFPRMVNVNYQFEGNRDWRLILRMTLVLGLSIIATVVFGVVLTLVLVILTNTDLQFSLRLAAIVVGLLICAQFLMSGSIEQRLNVSEMDMSDERVTAVVQRIAQQIDVPVPEIEIEQSEVANAYTIGVRPRNTRIVVTSGLVESLTIDELEAVIAHEFAHVVNRDGAVLTISGLAHSLLALQPRC